MGKRKAILVASALSAIALYSILLYARSGQDEVFDQLEDSSSEFNVRATAYHEFVPFTLPGARYVFQSAAKGSDEWHEFLTFKADEAEPIRRDGIRFVNQRTAYVFIGNYYLVTTDAGNVWFSWNSEQHLPPAKESIDLNISSAIDYVSITPDGNGTMVLIPYFKKQKRGPTLYTRDYGKSWSMEH
jgi:hypothetical protein